MNTSLSVFDWRQSSQRIWVDCPREKSSSELDRACQFFLKRGCRVAVLDDCPGDLISNISILENLWLPRAWCIDPSMSHFGDQLGMLVAEMSSILPEAFPDLRDLLDCKPAQLSSEQRRLVVLMRVILMNPEVVLLSSSWVPWLLDSSGKVLLKMMNLFLSDASWLAFDEIEPSLDGLSTGWARAQLLSL